MKTRCSGEFGLPNSDSKLKSLLHHSYETDYDNTTAKD